MAKVYSKFLSVNTVTGKIFITGLIFTGIVTFIMGLVLVQHSEAANQTELAQIIEIIHQLDQSMITMALLLTVVGFALIYRLISKYQQSLQGPIQFMEQLAQGELPAQITATDNELSGILTAANHLTINLRNASNFAISIGKGDFNKEFKPVSEKDILGNALVTMQEQLQQVAVEDKRRNWATEGLAKFGEILRADNQDYKQLGHDIISHLVNYLKANQGGLFIINDTNPEEVYLELLACYAFNRKKYLEKRIDIGEGLVGQAYLEKDTIFMTDIPDEYIHITSGLGSANPRCLLIVPLKINETIQGVIELASFQVFEPFEIEFVEKLAESIAATISSVKIKEHTQKLLHESQLQTEMMRAQEEEMRQNMEELSATQEEMARKEKELIKVLEESQQNQALLAEKSKQMEEALKESSDKSRQIDLLLDTITGAVFTRSKEAYQTITYVSKGVEAITGYEAQDILQGKVTFQGLLLDDYKEVVQNSISGALNFRADYEIEYQLKAQDGSTRFVRETGKGIFTEAGELEYIIGYMIDITRDKEAELEMAKLLEQAESAKEEILASQEQVQKVLEESQKKERYVTELIGASKDTIFALDKEYRLIDYNKTFEAAWKDSGHKITKGFNILQIFTEAEKPKHMGLYNRALSGETFELEEYIANIDRYFLATYSPLRDQAGEVFALAVFAKDVTEIVLAKKQAEELLHESQHQAEELRAQEEELKQNLEEMTAMQEEVERGLRESLQKERYIAELLGASKDTIFAIDKSYKLIDFNQTFKNAYDGRFTIEKGFNILEVLAEEQRPRHLALYNRALAGEAFEVEEYIANIDRYFLTTYSPLRNPEGEVFALAVFATDVTEIVQAKKQAEELLHESQHQAEELRAQEEELKQNLEEMSSIQESLQQRTLEIEKIRQEEAARTEAIIASGERLKAKLQAAETEVAQLREEIARLKLQQA